MTAKMAWGLTMRIFRHLFEEGWLKEGDLVADPFGGIGTTALAAASFGCPCILVELEQKFTDLANQNIELHRGRWEMMGKPVPVIICGDSRQFASIVQEAVDTVMTSPPWQRVEGFQDKEFISPHGGRAQPSTQYGRDGYGASEGQIGAMEEGGLEEVTTVITSPPFLGQQPLSNPAGTYEGFEHVGSVKLVQDGYGKSQGQLGGMKEGDHGGVIDSVLAITEDVAVSSVITSPPFQKSEGMMDKKWFTDHREEFGGGGVMGEYAPSDGNVGGLPEGSHEAVVDTVITSPPFEKARGGGGIAAAMRGDSDYPIRESLRHGGSKVQGYQEAAHSFSGGNIGSEQQGTYWQAVSEVYQGCFEVLKPGGTLCMVVKSYIRKGKIVDLPSQTLELLIAIGFEPLEYIRAWVTAQGTQKSLMPEIKPDHTVSRKSFFRRLAERKGAPPIDFEVVLIVRKPSGGRPA